MRKRLARAASTAGPVTPRQRARGEIEHRAGGLEARADREEGGQTGLELPLRRVPPPFQTR